MPVAGAGDHPVAEFVKDFYHCAALLDRGAAD